MSQITGDAYWPPAQDQFFLQVLRNAKRDKLLSPPNAPRAQEEMARLIGRMTSRFPTTEWTSSKLLKRYRIYDNAWNSFHKTLKHFGARYDLYLEKPNVSPEQQKDFRERFRRGMKAIDVDFFNKDTVYMNFQELFAPARHTYRTINTKPPISIEEAMKNATSHSAPPTSPPAHHQSQLSAPLETNTGSDHPSEPHHPSITTTTHVGDTEHHQSPQSTSISPVPKALDSDSTPTSPEDLEPFMEVSPSQSDPAPQQASVPGLPTPISYNNLALISRAPSTEYDYHIQLGDSQSTSKLGAFSEYKDNTSRENGRTETSQAIDQLGRDIAEQQTGVGHVVNRVQGADDLERAIRDLQLPSHGYDNGLMVRLITWLTEGSLNPVVWNALENPALRDAWLETRFGWRRDAKNSFPSDGSQLPASLI